MKDVIKVLAVDDEKFNLLLLQACLKGERFSLRTCSNAIETLNVFKKEEFDIVLSDIMMDGIDGFEVRNLIREINHTVPIIFLTSMVDDLNSTLLKRIVDDQYSYYMNKSFSQDQLIRKIEQAVSVYRERQDANRYYHKLEEDLALAEDVQMIMLPNWCTMSARMLMSYIYIPSMKVSGDMIELMRIDENRTLLFIGDIAGHGIQAALYMSAVQSFLKVLLLGDNLDDLTPHVLLNRIEKFFHHDLASKTYMTCLVAIFDFSRNHLSFQSAGHPGLICCSPAEGTAHLVDSGDRGGLPVGLARNNVYRPDDTVEYDFQDDSVFIAYTDGILDLCNAQAESIDDALFLALLGQLSKDSAPSVIPFRIRNVLSQIGYNTVPDDISLVAMQKRIYRGEEMQRIIPADTGEASNCALAFSNFIQTQTRCDKLATQTELLLSEFLNNVIVNGLESKKHTQTDIYILVRVSEKNVHIRVMDRGKEWNHTASHGSSDEILEEQNKKFATSGRGLAIIYNIASSITRSRYCGLNETLFVINRDGADGKDE